MREITTADAPASIGPYSQAIEDGDRVYVSGQGPLHPETGEIVGKDATEQTAHTLDNVEAILEAADCSLADVVQANVYMADAGDFEAINEVYAEYFSEPYPARAAIEAGDFAIPILVEIEVVASTRSRGE